MQLACVTSVILNRRVATHLRKRRDTPTSGGHQPLNLSLKVDHLPMRRQCDSLCLCVRCCFRLFVCARS